MLLGGGIEAVREEGDHLKRNHDAKFGSNAQCERSEPSPGSKPQAQISDPGLTFSVQRSLSVL